MIRALLLTLSNEIQSTNTHILCDAQLAEFRSRERLWSTPHLGLLTIGALLPAHWQIDYIDLAFEPLCNYTYDYVFMSPTTQQVTQAYRYARIFHQSNTKVVLGGPHVTMMPDEAMRSADTVFVGEGEQSIPAFLCDICRGVAGSRYDCIALPDLATSPVPLYALARKYPYKSIPIQLSRGCPHQCAFCLSSTIYGKRIRRKQPAQFAAELYEVKRLWRRPFLFFTDDNFLIDPGYSEQILDILQSNRADWYAFTDVSIYRKNALLNRLFTTGCRKLLIGFESLNAQNLSAVNASGFKKSKSDCYQEAVQTIQKQGIGVVGSFVLGLSEDTEETFDELYRFILDTCMYGTNITVSTPFPGTALYHSFAKQGAALSLNWDEYDGFTLLYEPAHITKECFSEKYGELIAKINAPERISRVARFFCNV